MPPVNPPVGYRIRQGETLAAYVWSADNVILGGHFRVLYDDGALEDWSLDQLTTGTSRARLQMFTNRVAQKDGWVIAGGFTFQGGTKTKYGMTYAQVGIIAEPGSDETWRATICQGYIYFGHTLAVGEFVEPEKFTLYQFQGTIAEDATAGTHVCSLTLTPATGSSFMLVHARIVVGVTATAQVVNVRKEDGSTRRLYQWYNGSDTTSGREVDVPGASGSATGNVFAQPGGPGQFVLFESPEILILEVSTAAVSVTQTFAVDVLVRGGVKPTAVLLDTIGTSTNVANDDLLVGVVQPT